MKRTEGPVLLMAFAVFLFPLLCAPAGEDEFPADSGQEREYDNGWTHSYVFPLKTEDILPLDKSLPLPEILRHLSRPGGYVAPEDVVTTGPFPLPLNRYVQSYIDYYTGPARRDFATWMRRSGTYRPMIIRELRKRGMPEELFYLCMIESGLSPKARSRAGAKGLWQFVRYTGNKFGLTVNFWVDERCDPVKSTEAALDYLERLYSMFGDWHLAAAAYNAGEGRVSRAVRRTGCPDYWCLLEKRALSRETRDYLPKIIAAAMINKSPETYGFYNLEYLPRLTYSTVRVDGAMDLRVLAECAGTSLPELKRLNPELNQFCTPPGVKSYKLKVPPGKSAGFYAELANLGPEKRRAFKKHVVQRGESIDKVSAGYRTSPLMLARMNGLSRNAWLWEGQEITVPVPLDARYDARRAAPPRRRSPVIASSGNRSVYVVEPGDTLWEIAMMFGVAVEDLKSWNNVTDPRQLSYGDRLVIYSEKRPEVQAELPEIRGKTKSFTYTVRPGDRCYFIARHYGIHTRHLISQNGLDSKCSLRPGQKLTLTVPYNAPETPPPTARQYRGVSRETVAAANSPPLPVARKPEPGPKGAARIEYTVKKGDSMWEIARDYDLHVADILAWNGLERGTVINPGQKLVLYRGGGENNFPAAAEVAAETARPSFACSCGDDEERVLHRVGQGESLWTIARRNNTRVQRIKACNGLESEALRPGDVLTVCREPEEPEINEPRLVEEDGRVIYTVEQGDSLWRIAREYDTHVTHIKDWNGLETESLSPGQKLVIYLND